MSRDSCARIAREVRNTVSTHASGLRIILSYPKEPAIREIVSRGGRATGSRARIASAPMPSPLARKLLLERPEDDPDDVSEDKVRRDSFGRLYPCSPSRFDSEVSYRERYERR